MGAVERGFKEEGEISLPQAAEGPGKMGTQGGLCGSSREDLGQSRLVEEVGAKAQRGGGFKREQEGGTGFQRQAGFSGVCCGGTETGAAVTWNERGKTRVAVGFFLSILYKNGNDAEEKEK